ncbi:unnamed protein product [Penicillium camemberti]|uniref:Str. FM013 n=1 Tax=Penicillium camemberti (strain FM 013) TaxID=1429867 RepID=A0A0G4P3X8_PENC3|nr:unnamed protein product [Penicillium camemberti]
MKLSMAILTVSVTLATAAPTMNRLGVAGSISSGRITFKIESQHWH